MTAWRKQDGGATNLSGSMDCCMGVKNTVTSDKRGIVCCACECVQELVVPFLAGSVFFFSPVCRLLDFFSALSTKERTNVRNRRRNHDVRASEQIGLNA